MKFIKTGEAMGEMLHLKDWSGTSLGPMKDWPENLQASVNTCLNSPIPMLINWGENLVSIYNEAYGRLIGNKHPSAFGANFREVWPEVWDAQGKILENTLRTGSPTLQENQLFKLQRNGGIEDRFFTLARSPLLDDAGKIAGVLTIAIETQADGERWKTEEMSAKLAAIVQTSNDAIISKTIDGIITSWNISAERMFGYKAKEVIGRPITILIPENRMNEEPGILEELRKTGSISHFETQRITKDRKLIDISLTISIIRDSSGNILGISKIARDITEKKQAERRISESEERLRLAAESAELGTWDLDIRNGRIISNTINHRIIEFSSLGPRFNRKEFLRIVHPDDKSQVNSAFKDALQYGKLSFEARLVRKDKTQIWVRIKGKTIFDSGQNPSRLLGTIMDITEQKNFLVELEESEKRFKTLANTVPVMIWTAGTDRMFDFVNMAWIQFTGRPSKFETRDGWMDNIHPDELQSLINIYHNSFEGRQQFSCEFRIKKHDGSYRWVLCEGIPRYAVDGTFIGFIGSCMDIHENKIATEELENMVMERTSELNSRNMELQQQKDFVETILDNSIDIMLVYDKEMRFRSFNRTAELKYGLKREEILGKRLLDVFPYAAGSQGYNDLQRALAGETIHNQNYRSAVTNLFYEDYLIPLKTPDNEVHSVLIIAHDITETIKTAEQLKQINEDLVKSNLDLEQFAYIASHDLQEPLRKIQTFANQLESNIDDAAAREKYFEKINSSAQRMSSLINAVLNYSRLSNSKDQFETVHLDSIIEQLRIDFELMITEKEAEIICEPLPSVRGISWQLNQMLSNLLSNSLKFSKKPPRIHITWKTIEQGAAIQPGLDSSMSYFEIIFKDNGIGFEQQYVDQIFTIFKRLHGREVYEGTGIGLALCKKIIDSHHGHISAKSELGKGTEFYIYLPA